MKIIELATVYTYNTATNLLVQHVYVEDEEYNLCFTIFLELILSNLGGEFGSLFGVLALFL